MFLAKRAATISTPRCPKQASKGQAYLGHCCMSCLYGYKSRLFADVCKDTAVNVKDVAVYEVRSI